VAETEAAAMSGDVGFVVRGDVISGILIDASARLIDLGRALHVQA
jgi:hypothetical protein